MIKVKATREGKVGGIASTGYVVDLAVSFVSLPSERAKFMFVRVTNPLNGKSTLAQVLDTGPWNITDDEYVFGGARPKAESQAWTNGAGIDLGERVWDALGMADNTDVEWEQVK